MKRKPDKKSQPSKQQLKGFLIPLIPGIKRLIPSGLAPGTVIILLTTFMTLLFILLSEIEGSQRKTAVTTTCHFTSLSTSKLTFPAVALLFSEGNDHQDGQNSDIIKIKEFLEKEVGQPALKEFQEMINYLVDEENLDLYLLYFWLTGQLFEGLALIAERLSITPEDFWLRHNGAAFLYGLGRYQLAREILESALRLYPDNPSGLNNLGLIWEKLGQKEKARKFLEQAVALDHLNHEANRALYLLAPPDIAAEKKLGWVKNSLQGGFREALSKELAESILPLSYRREPYVQLPPLPEDFLSYRNLTPFYQEVFLRMEEKESALKGTLDSLSASAHRPSVAEKATSLRLKLSSVQAYYRLSELEGQLDAFEREIERPTDIRLDDLISLTIKQLDSVFKDYQEREKICLELPRPQRLECLQKAREEYCKRYIAQADQLFSRYRAALLNYFEQAESRLKNFLGSYYFWLRYLPEEQEKRKRAEAELRLWKFYEGLWEKAFRLLTRLAQPEFKDCLPDWPLKTKADSWPDLTINDPFMEIDLGYHNPQFTFSLQAGGLVFTLRQELPALSKNPQTIASTIHLYPPESLGQNPVYLIIDGCRKLEDLGELGPWSLTGLSPGNSWKILINLSLSGIAKN